MCYYAEFVVWGHADQASEHVFSLTVAHATAMLSRQLGISKGSTKMDALGPRPLGMGRAWPLTDKPLPMWDTVRNLIAVG